MRALRFVLCLVILLGPLSVAQAQESGPVYIVAEGDTLTAIAVKFGTSVEALVEANGIADPSVLFPGMPLVIPGFEGVSGVLATKEVAFGETLSSLSQRYGIAADVLMRLNRLVSPGRIFVGQSLIVPEAEANALALPEATMLQVRPGDTVLEWAARRGLNPWTLRILNHQVDRLWVEPGAILATPGGPGPASGLAAPVEAVEVTLSPAIQGRTEEIRLRLTAAATAEGDLGSWRLHFFPADDRTLVALQGIHAMAEPGFYDLDIRVHDAEGGELLLAVAQPLQVVEGGYPNDPPLAVPPQTIDPSVTSVEDAQVAAVVAPAGADRLWQGVFNYPVSNYDAFPSRFGSRRSYNNSGYDYYHAGLDFYYTSLDDQIYAPARGRVVFAGPLTVRGNTTFIDHGWGVYTGYLHQSEILASVGDLVEVGQVIGRVGDTGRVTGPHLHWEIWVGGVPVNPLDWVATAYP